MRLFFSQIFPYICISFIFGIFLASFGFIDFSFAFILQILGLSIFVSFCFSKKNPKKMVLFSFSLIFVSIGCFWFFSFNSLDFVPEILEGKTIKGVVVEEVDVRSNNERIVLSKISIDGEFFEKEKILIFTRNHSGVVFGDKIIINGRLDLPQKINNFDYPSYLAKDGISYISYYPEIKKIGHQKTKKAIIVDLKQKTRDKINKSLPFPHSSIVLAMILGDKNQVPNEWQEKLSISGVRHITAVSGLHVTTISAIFASIFLSLKISRKKSLLLSVVAILMFVVLTGFQSSAIRAGIMGSCLLFGRIFGRTNDSMRMIFFAGFAMLLFNPFLLKHDIGFQLSFLATIGIIQFSSFFSDFFKFLPKLICDVFAISFSAYFFTLPLIVYYFNEFSLIFPITNLLIIPFLYFLMLFAILFLFFSFIPIIGHLLLFLLWFSISYVVLVVNFFSDFDWSSASVNAINPFWVFFAYFFFALLLIVLGKKRRKIDFSDYSF